MQRIVLALIFAALLAAALAFMLKRVARAFERSDLSGAITTGSAMQRVSFFLLICLIAYVSLSGAN